MRRVRVILWVMIATLIAVEPVRACLWDRDTLAAEAAGLPGVIDVIVGRFERNPALFYEMRQKRVAAQIEKDPGKLALFDDAGVACDRLGRHDEAIAWMDRKRAVLDETPNAEHEYRYLANRGTFYVHRWFAAGADRSDMADLKKARELIARAIALNPDAHFGREKYQLIAIEWIIDPMATLDEEGAARYREDGDVPALGRVLMENDVADVVVEALSGLIVLGAAWESVDIYQALSIQLDGLGHASLSRLAEARVTELRRAERTSVVDLSQHSVPRYRGVEHKQVVDGFYADARATTDQWHSSRTAYMMARLERGEHPDTHPEFWNEWDDKPAAPSPPGVIATTASGVMRGDLVSVAIVGVSLLVLLWLFSVYRRKCKATRACEDP